ncbi:uncharacterized protein KD926_006930 [Aspergillus affinis]|uniref:uncharacterized protein n=1 Tax=Aspergillus affinis TaxID=1070780 RepID=UPI0022FF2099|nr:uncharacterized protein KD926_006930 [Aspergillus affinis]KAI9041354.1 hypothetical protein KD926_006930 [Aspergillus affinis]
MVQLTATTSLVLLSLLLPSALAADDLSQSIVGCNDLSCPKEGADDRCTVDDHTFLGVGLARIIDAPSSLEGISLVKGVNVSAGGAGSDNDKPTRPFTSVYYLGTPSDVKTSNLSGCAVIFNDPPSSKFDGADLEGNTRNKTDTRAAYGTCPDVVDQRCINALTKRASEVADDADSNPCSALERELKKDDLDDCKNLGGAGNGLGNFTVTSFGDLKSVSNSSAECWPITPKSDGLAEIAVETSHSNYTASALIDEAYKITPVLTVFLSGNGSAVDETSSQLTCLKVVTKENASEAENGESSSASALEISGGVRAAGMAVLLGTVLATI